jgi:hypothetical protein
MISTTVASAATRDTYPRDNVTDRLSPRYVSDDPAAGLELL